MVAENQSGIRADRNSLRGHGFFEADRSVTARLKLVPLTVFHTGTTATSTTSDFAWRGLPVWCNRTELLHERLGFGDFDGDGRTDVFNSRLVRLNRQSKTQSFVWWGARGIEQNMGRSHELKWRRFGDFNGNGTSDSWVTINRP
jgi:hypothetical protein